MLLTIYGTPNGLFCADVPLKNNSLTQFIGFGVSWVLSY